MRSPFRRGVDAYVPMCLRVSNCAHQSGLQDVTSPCNGSRFEASNFGAFHDSLGGTGRLRHMPDGSGSCAAAGQEVMAQVVLMHGAFICLAAKDGRDLSAARMLHRWQLQPPGVLMVSQVGVYLAVDFNPAAGA